MRVERHCVAKALLVIFRDSIAGWFAVPVAGTSGLIRAISADDLDLRCRKSVFRPGRFDVCSDPVVGHFWVQWRVWNSGVYILLSLAKEHILGSG